VKNKEVGQYREEHGHGEPKGPERSEARSQQCDGAADFDQRRDDPKPLPKADGVENLNHHRHADQLGGRGRYKRRRENALDDARGDYSCLAGV
jgi:hypothetical protein